MICLNIGIYQFCCRLKFTYILQIPVLSCKQHHTTKNSRWGLLSSTLLLLVPKCPFCFAGYTSAITICGIAPKSQSLWEFYLVGFLAAVILFSLLLRFRGLRTLVALVFFITGSVFIFMCLIHENITGYYIGAGLMLTASVVNRKMITPSGLQNYLKRYL